MQPCQLSSIWRGTCMGAGLLMACVPSADTCATGWGDGDSALQVHAKMSGRVGPHAAKSRGPTDYALPNSAQITA